MNILLGIMIGLFFSGCNNAQPKNSTEPKVVSEKQSTALYDGQLVRAKLRLDPKKPLSKEFIQELKKDLLDEHFSGSKENVYIVYSKTESFYYKCKRVGRKNIANVKINGRVRYTVKQVHPIKQTVHTSDIIPYYEDATIAGSSCKSYNRDLEESFKENMLTQTTKMFSLYMSEAEGKNVKEEIQATKKGLSGTYKSIGASFQEASHAVFTPIGKAFKGVFNSSMTQAEAASMSATMNNSFGRASNQLNATHNNFNNNLYGPPTTYNSSSKARSSSTSNSSSSSRRNYNSNITLQEIKEPSGPSQASIDRARRKTEEWHRQNDAKNKRNNAALRKMHDNAPRLETTYIRDPRDTSKSTSNTGSSSGSGAIR